MTLCCTAQYTVEVQDMFPDLTALQFSFWCGEMKQQNESLGLCCLFKWITYKNNAILGGGAILGE